MPDVILTSPSVQILTSLCCHILSFPHALVHFLHVSNPPRSLTLDHPFSLLPLALSHPSRKSLFSPLSTPPPPWLIYMHHPTIPSPLCCLAARLPPVRVEESSFSQDLQWLLERGVQFADVVFYAGDSGKELGWAHAAVLSAVSPYFKQLLVGRQAWERPMSRCACRERDSPHSLLSTWDGGLDDLTRTDGHLPGQLSRLVVKDPLLCACMWETLMFLYRGEHMQIVQLCEITWMGLHRYEDIMCRYVS